MQKAAEKAMQPTSPESKPPENTPPVVVKACADPPQAPATPLSPVVKEPTGPQGPTPIDLDDPEAVEEMIRLQTCGSAFFKAARAYGRSATIPQLAKLPEYLEIRKDIAVHVYALWCIVMVRSAPGSTLHAVHIIQEEMPVPLSAPQ